MAIASSRVKVLAYIVLIALIALVFILDAKRRAAEQELTRLSVQLDKVTGNQENKETAKRIVDRVRKLIDLPADTEPTVAEIVKIEELRSRNAFYNKAKNGDYLIVTSTRAILYDNKRNIILDVAPVQIQPVTRSSASTSSK